MPYCWCRYFACFSRSLDLSPLRAAAVPEPICAIVARCTTKPLTERPQQLSEVCDQIEAYVESLKSARRPPDLPTLTIRTPTPGPIPIVKVPAPLPGFLAKLPPALRSETGLMLLTGALVLVLVLLIYTAVFR